MNRRSFLAVTGGALAAGIRRPLDIREGVYRITPDNEGLITRLVERSDWKDASFRSAYILSVESTALAWYLSQNDSTRLPGPGFAAHLRRLRPTTLAESLYTLDSYETRREYWQLAWREPTLHWRPHPQVDALLADSRGELLWRDQLERLYRTFNDDENAAVAFTKDINKKARAAWEEAERLVFEDYSLQDVLRERTLLGIVRRRNQRGAKRLYDALRWT